MGFLERLRTYLERVERAPDGLPWVRVDVAAHRRHFIMERDRLGKPSTSALAERNVARGDQLRVFVEEVAERIEETLMPEAPPEDVAALVNHAITLELGFTEASGSPSRDAELKRISFQVLSRIHWDVVEDGWTSPARYAFEIRATRRRGDRFVITRSGKTFLDLPGVDGVRWLLTLEAAQSLGPKDPFRISPELATLLLNQPERHFDFDDDIVGTASLWPEGSPRSSGHAHGSCLR